MNAVTESNEVVSKTIETFTEMSEVTLTGIERLTALNLNMVRESIQQGVAASISLSRAQGDKQQDDLQNPLSGASAERLTAYMRDVQKILAETQSEFVNLIGKNVSAFSMTGPMGFSWTELLAKVAQQTSDMTASSVRQATEATKKLAANSSQQVRKSA